MEMLEKIISTLSGLVWGAPMLILLVGTGIYLTIILKVLLNSIKTSAFMFMEIEK